MYSYRYTTYAFLSLVLFSFNNEKITLKGSYHQSCYVGAGSDVINFSTNKFDREFNGCIGGSKSKGSYKIVNGNLILYNESYPKPTNYYEKYSSTNSITEKLNSNSGINIKISTLEKSNKETIPFANIVFYDNKKNQIKGNPTNMDGISTANFNTSDSIALIKVCFIGYDSYEFPIKVEGNRNYEITVFLAKKPWHKYIENGSDTLWNIKPFKNGFYFKYLKDDSTECFMIKCPGHKLCK